MFLVKIYFQKNVITYSYILHHHVKTIEKLDLLISGVISTVNSYEYFMKNKNITRTFCGC